MAPRDSIFAVMGMRGIMFGDNVIRVGDTQLPISLYHFLNSKAAQDAVLAFLKPGQRVSLQLSRPLLSSWKFQWWRLSLSWPKVLTPVRQRLLDIFHEYQVSFFCVHPRWGVFAVNWEHFLSRSIVMSGCIVAVMWGGLGVVSFRDISVLDHQLQDCVAVQKTGVMQLMQRQSQQTVFRDHYRLVMAFVSRIQQVVSGIESVLWRDGVAEIVVIVSRDNHDRFRGELSKMSNPLVFVLPPRQQLVGSGMLTVSLSIGVEK